MSKDSSKDSQDQTQQLQQAAAEPDLACGVQQLVSTSFQDNREISKSQQKLATAANRSAENSISNLASPGVTAKIAQGKFIVGDTEYAKKSSYATLELKQSLKDNYGGSNWKRGWIKYMTEAAGDSSTDSIGPFNDEGELAFYLEKMFPISEDSSPEAQFLKDAYAETNLSLVGLLWKSLSEGYTLQDGRELKKVDLIQALNTKDGKKFLGSHWRDKANEEHGDQIIQGKHEWILTSELMYVIQHAKTAADLEIWFMAAEILRVPTQDVIFNFSLSKDDVEQMQEQGLKLSELGIVGAHPGGLYEERNAGDDKKTSSQWNKQAVAGSQGFHSRLSELLHGFLNEDVSDIEGFLESLIDFHATEIWSGEFEGVSAEDAEGIETGFYSGTNIFSGKKDDDLAAFMERQQESYARDREILVNQARAILKHRDSMGSKKRLPIDISKMRELDEDSLHTIESFFKERDQQFKDDSQELAAGYQNIINQSPREEFEDLRQEYKLKWEGLYREYIQEKSDALEKVYAQYTELDKS